MCTALQELEDTGRREGRIEGHKEGRIEGYREGRIEGIVKTCMEFGATEEETTEKLQKQCGLEICEAQRFVIQYYR